MKSEQVQILTENFEACELSGRPIADHFVGVNNMVELGWGSQC